MARIAHILTLLALPLGPPAPAARRVASSGNIAELDGTAQEAPARLIQSQVRLAEKLAAIQALSKPMRHPPKFPRPSILFPQSGPRPLPQPARQPTHPSYLAGAGETPLIIQDLKRPIPRPPPYSRPSSKLPAWLWAKLAYSTGLSLLLADRWPLLHTGPKPSENVEQPPNGPDSRPAVDPDQAPGDPEPPHDTKHQPDTPLFPPSLWPFPRPNVGPEPALMTGAALVVGHYLSTTESPLKKASEIDAAAGNVHSFERASQMPAGGLHHALSHADPDQSGDDLSNPDLISNLQAPAGGTAGGLHPILSSAEPDQVGDDLSNPPSPDVTSNSQAVGVLNVGGECGGPNGCDGGRCRFCGTGFCCKKGSFRGGCDGFSGESKYVCTVAPPNEKEPVNMGKECWNAADCRSGRCGYCGSGLCCRMGVAEGGCDGSVGGIKTHQCVVFQAFSYSEFGESQSVVETSVGDTADPNLTVYLQAGPEGDSWARTSDVRAEDDNEVKVL